MVFTWAKKEFKNLQRAEEAGICAPAPQVFHKNILVMRYIGTRRAPAPQLKDVCPGLESGEVEELFEQIVDMMTLAYQEADLVHGDLSEYNILYHRKKAYVIDWGQAVVKDHPMSAEWLERDVKNITNYFNRLGMSCDAKEVKARVKGC